MAVEILTEVPQSIESGDTTRIALGYSDFPATAWTAALLLNIPGSAPLSITGTTYQTSSFLFVITAANSAALAAGFYDWSVRVTAITGGDVSTADYGLIEVRPNFGATVAKSSAQLQLDAAQTALTTLLGSPYSSVSFNGQSFSKDNQSSLIDIISRLQAIVLAERGRPIERCIRPVFV